MYKLTVKNVKGEMLDLSNNRDYVITEIDGLLPPKASLNLSPITGGDGSDCNNKRVEERNIVITVLPRGFIEANRIKLYHFFNSKNEINIFFENGSRKVQISGIVESMDGSLFENPQRYTVSIMCPQPYFQNTQSKIDELSKIVNAFQFPFATDDQGVVFSEYDDLQTINVYNGGDVPCGLIIDLYASDHVQSPVIYNSSDNTFFQLDYDIEPEEHIRINTKARQKSVKRIYANYEENIIDTVAEESTWTVLAVGDNVLTFSALSGAENLTVRFEHTDQYMGV